jgi:mRNA interferase HigB
MHVHLIKAKTIREFAQIHASSISSFEAWISTVQSADWDSPNDMFQTFASVDLLGKGSNRAIFDVGGNNYRIICSYYFNGEIGTVTLFVKWIGTHAEYDRLCEREDQYKVDKF